MAALRTWWMLAGAAVLVVVAVGVAGYEIGHGGRSRVFTVGIGMAYAVPSGGTAYLGTADIARHAPKGFAYALPPSLAWVDPAGTIHEGGRPPCLPYYHVSRVEMETVKFRIGGAYTGTVLWVRC